MTTYLLQPVDERGAATARRIVFPNGLSAYPNGSGHLEVLVAFTRQELAAYDFRNNPQGKAMLERDVWDRATGSTQLQGGAIHRVGSLSDARVLFQLSMPMGLFSGKAPRAARRGDAVANGDSPDSAIRQAAGALVTKWLFPDEDAFDTPSVDDMARADVLGRMLIERMQQLAREGADFHRMGIAELLPGVQPHAIELTEADY